MNLKKISFLGCGSWGGALGLVLSKQGVPITIWHRNQKIIDSLALNKPHYLLPSLKFPDNVQFTSNIEKAVHKAEIIILATPSQAIRNIIKSCKKYMDEKQIIVNVAKGIETDTLMTASEVIKDVIGKMSINIVTLSGPSHAEEVIKRYPTALVAASSNVRVSEKIQKLFSNEKLRVYVNDDIRGVELGGSLKNVIAIASGIAEGIGYADNTKAALVTRGLAEVARLGSAMGGLYKTFSGLSGIGDLMVTCYSKYSRNRFVGEEIGRGNTLESVLDGMTMVAEGVKTTESVYRLSKKYTVPMPISHAVYDILFKNKNPKIAIEELMARELNEE